MAKVQQQDPQARHYRGDVHRHHDGGVVSEADLEEVGRDDVHEVGDDQRQAGGIGDEAGGHDESERRGRREPQGDQHRQDDGREDQSRAVVGEQRGNHRAQQHDAGEQASTGATSPTCDMQRGPLEESSLVEQQADDDDGDESRRGVPDDVPHDRDVGGLHDAGQQGQHGTERCAPADAQTTRLPDDQDEREDEDQERQQHGCVMVGGRDEHRKAVSAVTGQGRAVHRTGLALAAVLGEVAKQRVHLIERCPVDQMSALALL